MNRKTSDGKMPLKVEITSSNSSSCAPYALIITNTVLVSVVCLRPEYYRIKMAVLAILFASDSIAFLLGVLNNMDFLTRGDHLERQDKATQSCFMYRLQATSLAFLFNAILLIIMNQRRQKLKSPENVQPCLSNVLCLLFNGIAWYIPTEINSRLVLSSMCLTAQEELIHCDIWGLDLIFVLYVYRGVFIGLAFVSDYLNRKNEDDDEKELESISYL